ncbi:MAG TPA: (Fe-S)-binding protein, partial [Pseudomonadota bacterium]|nr:(Fe-S)-binding protein [Pseudomonadota bacterium]
AAAFDDRIKKSMRALVEVLHAAGTSFAVLGKSEGCSGDPARRAGNEFVFQEQAQANVDAFNEAKVKRIVTSCPHCFHTLKNEYPQFGGNYEVLHHSELLAHLLSSGKLQPDTKMNQKVTFHDSCYLGRWNGVYDAPRTVIDAVATGVIELGRKKERGFCCGAGGGRMWQEEKGPRVNRNRTEEVLQSGAEVAAVACPFCTIMITDGVKDAQAEEKVQVLDIAEVVRKTLKVKAEKKAQEAQQPADA